MSEQFDVDRRIEQEFEAGWNNNIPFFYLNSPNENMPETYINVLSFSDTEQNVSIASNEKVRNICSLVGEIRTPLGTGDGYATKLAEVFAAIFRNEDIGGIKFGVARKSKTNEGSHFGINVFIPYDWDSTTAII